MSCLVEFSMEKKFPHRYPHSVLCRLLDHVCHGTKDQGLLVFGHRLYLFLTFTLKMLEILLKSSD